MVRKLTFILVALIVLGSGSLGWARNVQFDFSHQVKQADSVATNKLAYKDTLTSELLNFTCNRIWLQFQKHAPAAGTDSNFASDSAKFQMLHSFDGLNFTVVTIVDSPQIPLFATVDSVATLQTTIAKAIRFDSTAIGRWIKFRAIVKDTSGWSHGILGNTYGRKLQLLIEEVQ